MMPLEERQALDSYEARAAERRSKEIPQPRREKTQEEMLLTLEKAIAEDEPCPGEQEECWLPDGSYIRYGQALPLYPVVHSYVGTLGNALADGSKALDQHLGEMVGARPRKHIGFRAPTEIVRCFRRFGYAALSIVADTGPSLANPETYIALQLEHGEAQARTLAPIWLAFLDDLEELGFDREILFAYLDTKVREHMKMGGDPDPDFEARKYDLFESLVGEAGGATEPAKGSKP
jgi:hypothetical protein